MTTGYFIAGSIFIALSILWAVVKWIKKRNNKYEQAKKDLKRGIANNDWDLVDDARRRLR